VRVRTKSAMKTTSSSEPPIMRSSNPGTIWSNFVKIWCSLLSLVVVTIRKQIRKD
jgi:hypothetical protein